MKPATAKDTVDAVASENIVKQEVDRPRVCDIPQQLDTAALAVEGGQIGILRSLGQLLREVIVKRICLGLRVVAIAKPELESVRQKPAIDSRLLGYLRLPPKG